MGFRHHPDCSCGNCLLDRIVTLESQVASLQCSAPRGIELPAPVTKEGCQHEKVDVVPIGIARDKSMNAGWCASCGALYFDGAMWPRWRGWRVPDGVGPSSFPAQLNTEVMEKP